MTTSPFAPDLLAGKRILITGGGTGLGRGVARHLVDHGAEVHLWGRRGGVLAEARRRGVRVPAGLGAHRDRRRPRRRRRRDEPALGRDGALTGVLNNAAANFIAPTESLSPRAFDAVTSTVMTGTFHTTHAAGRRWIAAGLPGSVLSTLTTWQVARRARCARTRR
ncbi:MAG: hypothetical protein QOE59_7 [Actinomycetota bacterium]|nr:hypothetical protein [Actinomycetota bacterium]